MKKLFPLFNTSWHKILCLVFTFILTLTLLPTSFANCKIEKNATAEHSANTFINASANTKAKKDIIELSDTLSKAGVISSYKLIKNYKKLATAVSSICMNDILSQGLETPKDLSVITPSFIMPNHGSSMTSSMYMRGFGARIGDPAVGLYIDDIPITDKNAYDFDMFDIRRIDILRGPQGTLFGRNALCGVISITSINPSEILGHRALFEYGSKNRVKAKYSYFGTKTAVSLSYKRRGGFYKNQFDNSTADRGDEFGFRFKFKDQLGANVEFENIFSLSYTNENGFPYGKKDNKSVNVCYNDNSNYKRLLGLEGAKFKFHLPLGEIRSISSLQYLGDKMNLDQDFTKKSMFSLQQKQHKYSATQEIIFKPTQIVPWWDSQSGVFAYAKYSDTNAPVTFLQDGIKELIEDNANSHMPPHIQAAFGKLDIVDEMFLIHDNFDIYTYNLAAYHESIFSFGHWDFSIGARLDREYEKMNYDCGTTVNYAFPPTISLDKARKVESTFDGKLKNKYWKFTPKASAVYSIQKKNHGLKIYGLCSEGFKSGGFNTQIFSDIMNENLKDDLKKDLFGFISSKPSFPGSHPGGKPSHPGEKPSHPGETPSHPGGDSNQNKNNTGNRTTYKPEKSINFESGITYSLDKNSHHLEISTTIYHILCKDQQLTVLPKGKNTGRMMTNAGKSNSTGVEIETAYNYKGLNAILSYGHTSAKFKDYNDGNNDFSSNTIPYQPENTFFARMSYTFKCNDRILEAIQIGADYKGIGKIYWNESNTVSQPYYGTWNADINFQFEKFNLYAKFKNICNKDYNTFYFKSVGNEFYQSGIPFRWNIGLSINF